MHFRTRFVTMSDKSFTNFRNILYVVPSRKIKKHYIRNHPNGRNNIIFKKIQKGQTLLRIILFFSSDFFFSNETFETMLVILRQFIKNVMDWQKKIEKNMGKINGDASREKTTLQDHRVKTRNMNFKLMYIRRDQNALAVCCEQVFNLKEGLSPMRSIMFITCVCFFSLYLSRFQVFSRVIQIMKFHWKRTIFWCYEHSKDEN